MSLSLFFSGPLCAAASGTEHLLFKKSLELYQQNDFAASSRLLVQLIRKNPRNSLYWFNLGNCYFMANRYDQAAQYFQQVIVLKSSLTPAAKLYRAKALTQLGKKKDAEVLLQELLLENPPGGLRQEAEADLALFEAKEKREVDALNAYRAEQYPEAEQNLRSLGAGISPEGRLLLGMTLAKQNKNSLAEAVLRELIAKPGLTEDQRLSVRRLWEDLRRQKTPYWMLLDVSYGSADNVYLEGRSLDPLKSGLGRAGVEIGYHFHKGQTWSEKLVYVYNNETPSEVPELMTQTHSLMFPTLYQSPVLSGVLQPYYQLRSWDQTAVSEKTGVLLDVAQEGSESALGLEITGDFQKAKTSVYSYLSGNSYSIRPYYEIEKRYFILQFHWLFGFDGIQDIVYTDGSRLPLTHNYQGPGARLSWIPTRRWSLHLSVSQLRRSYLHMALPDEKKRNDTETETSLKITYAGSSRWGVFGLIESILNSSSLENGDVRDKNYRATTVSVGMNWQVF